MQGITTLAIPMLTFLERLFFSLFENVVQPGVDSASNINENLEYFLGVKTADAWG